MDANTDYYFKVVATAAGRGRQSSSPSSEIPSKTLRRNDYASLPRLAAPQNVRSTEQNSGMIRVAWNAVSNATAYEIYYSTTDGFAITAATPKVRAAQTEKQILRLSGNTPYYFRVVAIAGGYQDSLPSSQGSGRTSSKIKLVTPNLSTVLSRTANSITIRWSSGNPWAGSYTIYYKAASASSYTEIAASVSDYLGKTISGLQPDTEYQYKIKARIWAQHSKVREDSDESQVFTARTLSAALPPAKPSNARATATPTTITVSWQKPNPAARVSGYEVAWGDSDGALTNTASVSGADTLSHKIAPSLPISGETVYIQVRATGSSGGTASAWLKTSVVIPNKTRLPAPTVTASTGSASTVKLTWGQINNAKAYRIYFAESAGDLNHLSSIPQVDTTRGW
ncbi:MAG: fibronectin type III domain-containing protein, partial [Spirochaetota bacterium]